MRKTFTCAFLLLLILLLSHTGRAQTITVSIDSTNSICYNDGSVTVHATGGTTPYTYTIVSGPSNPNLTYPITLPAGQNTFVNLPSGSFTVRVTDASGHTTIYTAVVGGNYQYPGLNFDTTSIPGIIAYVTGGHGPYQYAISSTSANTGFGPYQSSDTFRVCPGKYWVRVRDSCQNIFTNVVTYSYLPLNNILCINYSKGFFSTQASGGYPPYTYTFDSITNNTGIFSGLPPYFSGPMIIRDGCGVDSTVHLAPTYMGFFEICPFDSNMYISGGNLAGHDTLYMTCTDCTPVQTVSSINLSHSGLDVVFQHIIQGHNYHIVVNNPACGGDTFPYTIRQPSLTPFNITHAFTSCRSVEIAATGFFDSVVLKNSSGIVIMRNTTGLFFDLPDGNYVATAYTHSSGSTCFSGTTASTAISVPHMPPTCTTLTKDSSCNTKWELLVLSDPSLYDTYTLAYRGDTVAGSPTSSFSYFFYNLDPGTYTLISDSGCAEQLTLAPLPIITSSAVSYLPCVGSPSILPSLNVNGNACATSYNYALYKADTIYHYISAPDGSLIVADSGWYTLKWYISSNDAHGNIIKYDTLCPLDTNRIFVSTSHVPTPASNTGYICGTTGSDTVYYHIYGGFIPYTVEIPGYDTTILQTNTGMFPAHTAGQYSMIVYDNCGISRSITFSIIDTCTACPVASVAAATATDTLSCAGDTIHLISSSANALTTRWIVNGQLYSQSADTILIVAHGGEQVMLKVSSISGCRDSIRISISDTCTACPLALIATTDTIICAGNSVPLQSNSLGAISYQWLVNGSLYSTAADTILIATGGPYHILLRTYSRSGCKDSAAINVSTVIPYSIHLGQDTNYCDAFSRILSTGVAVTQWSTGQTGAQISVDTAGVYWAVDSNQCGRVTDTIRITSTLLSGLNLSADQTTICDDRPDTVVLHASIDSVSRTMVAFVWSGGQIDSPAYSASLYAYTEGSYQVTAKVGQCVLMKNILITGETCDSGVVDTNCIHKVVVPNAFSPNGDSKNDEFIVLHTCPEDAFTLHIYDRWGQLVYESSDITHGWGGNYKGKQQPAGVYLWFVSVRHKSGEAESSTTGTLTLVR